MSNDSSKMFGEEKIGKLLFRFSIPIIMSMLISELYGMVDTMFVGNQVGGEGIAALTLVFPIQRIIIASSMMIALGTSTAFSRSNGSGDKEKSRKVVNNGFSLALTLMISLTFLIFTFREGILVFLGASESILPLAKEYLGIIIFGSTFLSLTIFISNIILALGNNKVAIVANSIGAITNIIIDYILVVNTGMGVKGAAIATTLSQILGFSYAYYKYCKAKKKHGLTTGFNLDKKILIPILLVGVSAFIVEAEDGIVMAVLNNLLLNTVGDEGIVILGVITKIYMFLFVTMFGLASAMQPIAAYNVGAKNYLRLKEIMKKTCFYSFMTSTIMWGLTIFFAPSLIGLFVKDGHIIRESTKAFRIMVMFFPLISVYYVSIFYYQALGKARASVIVSVFRQIIIMIPVAIFLMRGLNLGALGAWLSYPISDILAFLLTSYLMRQELKELDIQADKKKKMDKLILNW